MTENINTSTNEDNHDDVVDLAVSDIPSSAIASSSTIDSGNIEKVQGVIDSLASSYIEWALDDIKNIEEAYILLEQTPENYTENLQAVFKIAHDMKGQGGSFGFYSISEIGDYLCRFINAIESQPTANIIALIRLHIEAMRIILKEKIKDSQNDMVITVISILKNTLQQYVPDLINV